MNNVDSTSPVSIESFWRHRETNFSNDLFLVSTLVGFALGPAVLIRPAYAYRSVTATVGVTRAWNALPIVEKLPKRRGTPFPLLKCLRTHYGRHCGPFSGQKCTRLYDFSYRIYIFTGVIPPGPIMRSPILGSRSIPISALLTFCSCFTKRQLDGN